MLADEICSDWSIPRWQARHWLVVFKCARRSPGADRYWPFVNGRRDHRRDVAQFQMQGVIEFRHPGGSGRRDVAAVVMAFRAGRLWREKVVFGFGTRGRGGVARRAVQLE